MTQTKRLDPATGILIVGLGLMGGSYARALSRQGYTVRAITRDAADIAYAKSEGMIEDGTTQVREDWLRQADLIVFALYPETFLSWIREHGTLLRPGTVITDVTGVKSGLVEQIQALLPPGVEFVPAHPMAGRERSGVRYSDDGVFVGANYIVTPTSHNTPAAIALCETLGYTLGFATVSRLTPEEHDDMIAFLSQLTHCIAVALMTCNESPHLEAYTGDSFRDLTRIAKINDAMWSELFLLNKRALLRHIDAFEAQMSCLREMLCTGDREGMRAMMRHAAERRVRFDKKTGGEPA